MRVKNRRKFFHEIQNGLYGREKYSLLESKELVREIFTEENNIYQHFTTSDEIALKKYKEADGSNAVDIEKETKIMKYLFSMMSGVREEPEYAAIANLVKVIVLSSEHRWLLHECGYSRTKEILIDNLLQLIFVS